MLRERFLRGFLVLLGEEAPELHAVARDVASGSLGQRVVGLRGRMACGNRTGEPDGNQDASREHPTHACTPRRCGQLRRLSRLTCAPHVGRPPKKETAPAGAVSIRGDGRGRQKMLSITSTTMRSLM